jgi:hypothetical protein
MNIRIGHSSKVIDFLGIGFDTKEINGILKEEVEAMIRNLPLEKVND